MSLALLGLIYFRIDQRGFVAALKHLEARYLLYSFGLMLVIKVLSAYRLRRLVADQIDGGRLPLPAGLKMILAASSLNLVLPSRLGEMAKVFFLTHHGCRSRSQALVVVTYEQMLDLLGMILVGALGFIWLRQPTSVQSTFALAFMAASVALVLLLARREVIEAFLGRVKRLLPASMAVRVERVDARFGEYASSQRPRHLGLLVMLTTSIWIVHCLQIWSLLYALNPAIGLGDTMALAPMAITVGLLPIGIAGIGTRDAAIIYFFGTFLTAQQGAVVGMLLTVTRYLFPALLGSPFMMRYLPGKRVVCAE